MTEPMTDERLTQIREIHTSPRTTTEELLAEVDRLRAENTVLKARIQQLAEAAKRDQTGQRQHQQDQDDQEQDP